MRTQISGNILKRFGKFKVISALNYQFRWQNGKFNSSGTKAKKWASQEIVKNMSPRNFGPKVLLIYSVRLQVNSKGSLLRGLSIEV